MTKFKQTEIGMIPEDWEVKKLKEVTLQIFSGGTPNTKKEKYWNGNLLWLSSGETSQTFIRNTERKITQEGVDNSSTRLAKKEDIVVAGAGQGHTRGQPSFCLIDTYINQSVVVLRANKEQLKPLFLFYNLLSRYDELRQLSDAHSSRGSLTTKLLADMYIKLAPLYEQEFISKILSDLDFKIELNQQMNKTLEEIGQAIFKRWFVDFEFPNEKGKPYKSSGGEMVESELGKIPKGWKVAKFGDYIEFVKGKKPSEVSEIFVEGYLPQILIENLDGKEPVFADASKLKVVQETEPIMVMDGASSGRIEIGHQGILGSTLAKIIAKDDSLTNSYVLYFLKNYQKEINQNTTGTSIPHTDKERIKRFLVALPNKKLLGLFDKLANNILYLIINNKREIKSSAVIRDSLLPRLMSGKIRVPVEV